MKTQKATMTRQEFLKKSSAAVLGLGLAGVAASPSTGSPKEQEKSTAPLPAVILGRSGLSVSVLGFGASRTMEPELVRAALDGGITWMDTGRSYFNGRNEIMVGKVVEGRRKNVVIQSKFRLGADESAGAVLSAEGVSRMKRTMDSAIEASLKALGTDYIDVWLIHGASSPELVHHEAVLEFFDRAKKSGKIRAHGFSTHSNQIELLKEATRRAFFDVVMAPYNHKGSYVHSNTGQYAEWDQQALEAAMDEAKAKGIGLVAMKTCSGGPYAPDATVAPSFEGALRWLHVEGKAHAMAVAIASFDQLEEDLRSVRK